MTKTNDTTSSLATNINLFVTFGFFLLEAILHFNIGKTGRIGLSVMPSFKEFMKIAAIVAFFSIMSVIVANYITEFFAPIEKTP